MNRRILSTLLIFGLLFIFSRWFVMLSDDFRVSNVQYEVPYHPEWEVNTMNPVQNHLLGQVLNLRL